MILEILVLLFSEFFLNFGAGWVEALGFRVGVLVEGQRRLETGRKMFLRIYVLGLGPGGGLGLGLGVLPKKYGLPFWLKETISAQGRGSSVGSRLDSVRKALLQNKYITYIGSHCSSRRFRSKTTYIHLPAEVWAVAALIAIWAQRKPSSNLGSRKIFYESECIKRCIHKYINAQDQLIS